MQPKRFLDEQLSKVNSTYNQWDTTNRASLTTIITTCEEYKDVLFDAIEHSYLAKCEAQYLNDKKQSLCSEEALVVGDFAENYQFLIQDRIQSYHCVVRSTLCYIQLLFILKMSPSIFGTSPSVLYQMATGMIHNLSMRFKRQ